MATASGSVIETLRAAKIIESVVGNAWATAPDGRFIYVTPDAFPGVTLDDLNDPPEEGAFGWKRVMHAEDYDDAAAAWRHCLRTGEPYNVEHRILRANGTYGRGRSSGQPLRGGDGRILGWYGALIETAAACAPASSIQDGVSSFDTIHLHDRDAVAQAAARAFWTSVSQVIAYRHREPDGSYRLRETRIDPPHPSSVQMDELDGRLVQPAAVVAPGGNIDTEVVRCARIIETLFGNGWAFDGEGRWIYLPIFAQTTLGRTPEELNASLDAGDIAWKLLLHPDEYAQVEGIWRRCLATGDHFNAEFRIRRKTGYAWARSAARPVRDKEGRITGWFGTSIDIDAYRRTDMALRDRERELSQLVDMVPSHLWRLNAEGEPTFFNKRMADFIGLDVADMDRTGTSRLAALLETVHPDDADAFRDALASSLATGERFSMRYRLRRVDGVYHWMSSRAEPMRDQDGRIVQWYGLCHDIDEQVHAEEALQDSERMFRQLVETLPAMIDCAAPDGEPVYRSRQLRDFLGYDLEDLDDARRPRLAGTLDAGVHPDDLAAVKEDYAHALATGEPYARKHRLRRFDGEYRWVETRAAAMRGADGSIVQWNVICLDIENEIQAQEKLRLAQESLARASQAASLAELSASIAHEVNQPLAAVVANSHACQRWLDADPPNIERAQKTVERITRDANSAADVVNRVRALFRQSVEARTCMSPASVIAEACEVMAEEASRLRIRVDARLEPDLPCILFDRVQVQQVLVNLIRNGMDAMNSVAADRVLGISATHGEGFVRIAVSDHGPGVEFPDRIFEPFFTTKENGMGMGLAICRSIVESHGGRLWVEKNEPTGATFIFTLPIETDARS